MILKRLLKRRRVIGALAPALLLFVLVVTTSSTASPDRKAPRIVSAAMRDADRDFRADAVRVTFSEPIRHPRDADARYPFAVAGYRIKSVGAAAGKVIVISLAERADADDTARPRLRYARTRSKPVKDRTGNQAAAQTVTRVRAHGNAPVSAVTPQLMPGPGDRDGDGILDAQDCGPDNPAINLAAADAPDLAFVDANCDGIDGNEKSAVFASPLGKDTNPGTKESPKREIQAAVATAAEQDKYVLAAAGSYDRVKLTSGVGIYGGYDATTWSRKAGQVTLIEGAPEGILADNATRVVLQLLKVRGATNVIHSSPGRSFYGIRAINGSRLTLQQVSLTAGRGDAGESGTRGVNGVRGEDGGAGGKGECGGSTRGPGGAGGASQAGRSGGSGGRGGHDTGGATGTGAAGEPGEPLTPGGIGGKAGDPGRDGANGAVGQAGAHGVGGSGGSNSTAGAVTFWVGKAGGDAGAGTAGDGGGGGGGGGGQVCTFCNNGSGNGGGGGGGAGGGGTGGTGGGAGGGSFGLYLHDSFVTVSDTSSITPGPGGDGGRGGAGGVQGGGGDGGAGSAYCKDEIGEGGHGGAGGSGGGGGGGGGGAGGPSIGIFKGGTSKATVSADSMVAKGTPGAGGDRGNNAGVDQGYTGEAGISQAIYPT